MGLWLDNNRDRNFSVNVELEATDYSKSIVPLIEFKPILKHCDLLRLFIRTDRQLNRYRDDEEEDSFDAKVLYRVPWLGPGDSAGSFEKKRRIVLSIFKDDNTPYKDQREDFRALLGCCENLKSLVFSTSVSLFTWGANEEYKTEGESQLFLKKDDEEDEDREYYDEENEEEKKIDEEAIRLRKIEAEDKAKRCLQGLEEIVIACTTIGEDDSKEDKILLKYFEFMKQQGLFPADAVIPEKFRPKKSSESQKISEFLKYFVTKINENARSLKYLSLCHCYFDCKLASKKSEDSTTIKRNEEDYLITNMLTDKDWNFDSVETIEMFPGKNDDYNKLKNMLVQMKKLNELIINLNPFYKDLNIPTKKVEEQLKDIRQTLPNLSIKITDKS